MALEAVPKGGGFLDGLRFLLDGDRVTDSAVRARATVDSMLAAVRAAPDADPKWTDEDICEKILAGVERASKRKEK